MDHLNCAFFFKEIEERSYRWKSAGLEGVASKHKNKPDLAKVGKVKLGLEFIGGARLRKQKNSRSGKRA